MKAEDYFHYTYCRTPAPWAEKSLLVSDAMAYTADPDFLIDRRTFYNYLAIYVHQGTFYLEQYGRSYTLRQGDVGIISLMDPHRYYSNNEDVAHLLWFHFRGAGTGGIMEMLQQNDSLPFLYHYPEIEQDFLKNFSLTESGCSETELAGHMYGLLMKILENAPARPYQDSNIPADLQRAAHFMEEQTPMNLTLDQISAQANMGKYYFSHMFTKWYRISPMQYYLEKKMEKACTLLLKSRLSVDEIAEQLGYRDTGYFRKVFKSYFGITPSAFRKG
ncbi:MAG: AraC family transcriptional regulator [Faecousia sp.]